MDGVLGRWRPVVERMVVDELDALAVRFAGDDGLSAELAKVSVLVQDDAPADDPDLLGRYTGVPVSEREPGWTMPPLVEIFTWPLLDMCTPEDSDEIDPDTDVLRDEIRVTLLHEIGHHLGLDHDRLEELGLS